MMLNEKYHKRSGDNLLLAECVDLGRAMSGSVDPPEELEPDVLLKGMIHHIFGPSESGKTIIVLRVIKRRIEAHQRVVVFDAENGTRTIAERLKQMGADSELVGEYLVYIPFPDLTMTARMKAAFTDLLDEIEPVLVVFDSWASFLAAGGLSENENADVEAWDTAFTKVAKMKGIASAIIDHTPHEHDRSRGAARKREVADVQWFVKKTQDSNRDVLGEAVLINKKDREGWLPGSVTFSIGGNFGRLTCERTEGTIETADPVSGLTPSERKVLDTLRKEFPDGARAGEWQRATKGHGVSRATHYRALSKTSLIRSHEPPASRMGK
jgi:archaellum biogenesis ATPase FlaH